MLLNNNLFNGVWLGGKEIKKMHSSFFFGQQLIEITERFEIERQKERQRESYNSYTNHSLLSHRQIIFDFKQETTLAVRMWAIRTKTTKLM